MSASTILLQTLVNGLVLGMLYVLIASGFTVVFGVLRVVNFAHGDVFMLSAFIALILFLAIAVVGLVSCFAELSQLLDNDAIGWIARKVAGGVSAYR